MGMPYYYRKMKQLLEDFFFKIQYIHAVVKLMLYHQNQKLYNWIQQLL